MPYRRQPKDGRVILVCINHGHDSKDHDPGDIGGTTMRERPGYVLAHDVYPPGIPVPGFNPIDPPKGLAGAYAATLSQSRPTIDQNSGIALKVYVCAVCGYVEMYNAKTVDPDAWKGV
jgi:hypothetical protein